MLADFMSRGRFRTGLKKRRARFQRLTLTRLEGRTAPALFRVVTTADGGAGSLRQAIFDANTHPGADTIGFQIPGSGLRTITPLSPLPALADRVVLDGFLQPDARPNNLPNGYDGVVRIELDGSLAGPGSAGLIVGDSADSSVLRGIAINRFSGPGVRLEVGASSITLEGLLVGVSADGLKAVGFGNAFGIETIGDNASVTIGGTVSRARNIIAGNLGAGIQIGPGSSAVTVQGNYLGVLADFSAADNGGPAVNGPANVLGNVLSGPIEPGGPAAPSVVTTVADATGLTVDVSFVAQGDRSYRLELFAAGRPQAAVVVSIPAAGPTTEHIHLSALSAPSGLLTATVTDLADILTSPLSAAVVVPLGQTDVVHVMAGAGASGNVLTNDGAPGTLTARLLVPPPDGDFQLLEDGTFGYTPLPGNTGLQSFLYAASLNGFDGPPVFAHVAQHPSYADETTKAQWDFEFNVGDTGGTQPLYGQSKLTDPYVIEFGGGKFAGVVDFSWGVTVAGGVAQSDPFTVTLPTGLNSPRFFANAASGTVNPTVDLSLRGWYADHTVQVEYGHVTLTDVVITRFETSADTVRGTDTITLDFTKVLLKSREVDAKGVPGAWLESSWDRAMKIVSGDSLPNFKEAGGTTLTFEGGLQTDLSDYRWGLHQTPVGKPQREPFAADDTFNTALPGAVASAVSGKTYNAATLTTNATYPWTQNWTLSNVTFTRVAVTGTNGGLPEFDYELDMTKVMSQATDGMNTFTTAYDFATNKGDGGGSPSEQLIGSTKLADPYVLTFNGVGGNQLPILDFRWEVTNPGAPDPGLVTMTVPAGANSPLFFARCASNTFIDSLELSLRQKYSGQTVEYGRVTLLDAVIDSYHTSLADPAVDELAFDFGKIVLQAREVSPDGTPGSWSTTTWDRAKSDVSGTDLPGFTEKGGTTLKIEGAHETDLLGYSWGTHLSAGKGIADPLTAHDTFNIAFPATVGVAVTAKTYNSATLVTDAPEGPWSHTWTYHDVQFTHVTIQSTAGGLPAFDYEIEMTKVKSEASDTKTTYAATWDFALNKGDSGGAGTNPLVGATKIADPFVLTFNGLNSNQLAIRDFSWEVTRTGTTATAGNVVVTVAAGPNSPRFFANSASVTHVNSVEISLRTRLTYNGNLIEYGRVTLTDVVIDSYRIDDGDPATDTVALNFAKIEIRGRTVVAEGKVGSWITADWDRVTNTISGMIMPALAEGGGLTQTVGAAITDLTAFSWGVSRPLMVAEADPVGVTDTFNIATPALMASVAAAWNHGPSQVQAALPALPGIVTWQGSNTTFSHFALRGEGNAIPSVETKHSISKMVSTVATRGLGPVGKGDSYAMPDTGTLNVDAPGVTGNDEPWPEPMENPITVTLATPPPSGMLDFNSDGSFSYTPAPGFAGLVTFVYTPSHGPHAGTPATVSIRVTATSFLPTGKFDAGQFATTGTFNVTYTDNTGIKVSTIDDADVYVEGPWGYGRTARLIEVNPPGDGTPRTATYAIDIPGGSWEPTDNGNYSFYLVESQVFDTDDPPNAALPSLLGTVAVAVPPRVANVVVNEGAAQRSLVKSVTVTFDSVVSLPPSPVDAFVLERTGPGGLTGPVALAVDTSDSTALQIVAKLTFAGSLTEFGSLIDGRYTLHVLAGKVSAGGQALDGNGDGTGGDNYVLPSAGTSGVFRLFGDADGDNDVDVNDYAPFRISFGSTSSIFDFDNDGDVDTSDFGAFRQRFGASV